VVKLQLKDRVIQHAHNEQRDQGAAQPSVSIFLIKLEESVDELDSVLELLFSRLKPVCVDENIAMQNQLATVMEVSKVSRLATTLAGLLARIKASTALIKGVESNLDI